MVIYFYVLHIGRKHIVMVFSRTKADNSKCINIIIGWTYTVMEAILDTFNDQVRQLLVHSVSSEVVTDTGSTSPEFNTGSASPEFNFFFLAKNSNLSSILSVNRSMKLFRSNVIT